MVLSCDVVDVGGVTEDLKDPVPVAVLVVDPRLTGEKRVNNRQEELRRIERWVGFTRPDREGLSPMQVTCAQELVGRVEPALGFRSVASSAVHGGSVVCCLRFATVFQPLTSLFPLCVQVDLMQAQSAFAA
ncbi:hypothetical protein Ahy_A03g011841 [Arachis hypogaea]|uniref:Uncharacterized protein n=1 Tax=Arachis hypogaea TaxID=3818 RepID=A0A445DRX0_ARAHY|nr:hypothetical protein Ahy_A03g011841 [Arachis hypogaea]